MLHNSHSNIGDVGASDRSRSVGNRAGLSCRRCRGHTVRGTAGDRRGEHERSIRGLTQAIAIVVPQHYRAGG